MAFPFGLRNTVVTISHLVAQRAIPSPTNNEFMGMIESVTKSLHDLITEGPGLDSSSNSGRVSHHPSRECFMAETSKGHIESASEKEVTPTGNLGDGTEGRMAAPSHVGVEQLKAQK